MGTPPLSEPTHAVGRLARGDVLFVLGCTLLALALRVPLLDRSVWFDEACMSGQRIGTWEQLLATLYVDIHPPLFVAFMHGWGRLFGDGELALRLPALLAGLAALPLLFWTGSGLAGRAAARWATVLLALSPAHLWYSAEARLYTPMIALTLLAVGTQQRLLDPATARRRGLLVVHALTVVAMLALHYYLAVVVAALLVAAPLIAGWNRTVRQVVGVQLAGLALLTVFVVGKRALGEFETAQDYLMPLTPSRWLMFVVDWCWTGHTLLPARQPVATAIAYASQAFGGGLMGLGLVKVLRGHRSTRWLMLVGLLALPVFLLGCAICGYDRTYMERSMIPVLPFVLLLASVGLVQIGGRAEWLVGSATLLFAAAAVVGLFVYRDTHWTVYKPNSDWRSATAWLGREIDTGGDGRAIFTSTPNPRPLSYYDARIQDVKNLALPIEPERLGASVRRRLGSWLGAYAERTFREFAAHNARLLAHAKLKVYRAPPDPARLDLAARSKDDVCYLVQDEWHPHRSVDSSMWDLLASPRVEVLASAKFPGIAVHKVRILP